MKISTSEIIKYISNTNEGSSLSTNKELKLDSSFTQGHIVKNVTNTNTKGKGKQLLKQLFQKEKCKKQSITPTKDRNNLDTSIGCGNPDELTCCDLCPSSFPLKCIAMKKKVVGTPSWHCEICQHSKKKSLRIY